MISKVTESVSSEPGWLSGEVRGHVGWFPEAYVEKMDQLAGAGGSAGSGGVGVGGGVAAATAAAAAAAGWGDSSNADCSTSDSVAGAGRHHLEGIQELPENVSDNGSIAETANSSAFTPVTMATDHSASPVLGQVRFFQFYKKKSLGQSRALYRYMNIYTNIYI